MSSPKRSNKLRSSQAGRLATGIGGNVRSSEGTKRSASSHIVLSVNHFPLPQERIATDHIRRVGMAINTSGCINDIAPQTDQDSVFSGHIQLDAGRHDFKA